METIRLTKATFRAVGWALIVVSVLGNKQEQCRSLIIQMDLALIAWLLMRITSVPIELS